MGNNESEKIGTVTALLQSFYSEFFGTFIPGFIAVVSVMSVCLVAAIYWGFVENIKGIEDFVTAIIKKQTSIQLLSSWLILGVVCAFSYAVGAIIYRRAPKIPDAMASYRQWKNTDDAGKRTLAVDFARLAKDGDTSVGWAGWPFWRGDAIRQKFGKQMDYPYPHLRQYLATRGHHCLLKFVPWCYDLRNKSEPETLERSKTKINIIKQLVISEGRSALSRDLVRNESHIRLLSSLWYILRFLQEIFVLFIVLELILVIRYILLGLSVSAAPFMIKWTIPSSVNMLPMVPLAVFIVSLFFVWFLKRNIVICFHYVRTREIVMALHAAEIVYQDALQNKKKSVLNLFEKFIDHNEKFQNKYCQKCVQNTICGGKYDKDD